MIGTWRLAMDFSALAKRVVHLSATLSLLAFSSVSSFANAASIIGLGGLGGSTRSFASAISADGSTVVGNAYYSPGKQEAFIYQNGVMSGLGSFNGSLGAGENSEATSVSGDGSIVVGATVALVDGTYRNEAFVYQNGEMTGLGDLPGGSGGGPVSIALAISDDGSTIVGSGTSDSGSSATYYNEAFVYQNGVMTGLGNLPVGSGDLLFDRALGVSADGSIIVGHAQSDSLGSPGYEAVIYQNGVVTPLGDLPGGTYSGAARDVLTDGTVFGYSNSALGGNEAFIYANGIMTGLGDDLPGGSVYSEIYEASADGRRLVGISNSELGLEAVLWEDDGDGGFDFTRLQDKLFMLGVDISLDGWEKLRWATGISDDGNTIAGSGIRNGIEEAFIVNLSTTAIPIPAAAWLFLSSLTGLLLIKRNRP